MFIATQRVNAQLEPCHPVQHTSLRHLVHALTRPCPAGHFESGATATLQAVAAAVPGAALERAKLLWHSGHENRALAELQAARRRCAQRPRTVGHDIRGRHELELL